MPILCAVLTGDLINSTKAGAAALAGAMVTLTDCVRRIEDWTPGSDNRFTRSRGDGWQIVLGDPALALRAALLIQARLSAATERLTSRIAIGIGAADTLGSRDLSDASGSAFTLSGQGLDTMARQGRLAVTGVNAAPFLQAIADLADEIARRWSVEQAEAMALALPPDDPTLKTMALQLGISTQAVNYRLQGAGLRPIRAALRGWEAGFAEGLVNGGDA